MKGNNSEIIVRLKSPLGMNRFSVSLSSTFLELKRKIFDLINIPPNEQVITIEGSTRVYSADAMRLSSNPSFVNGVQLHVASVTGKIEPKPVQTTVIETHLPLKTSTPITVAGAAIPNAKPPVGPNTQKPPTGKPEDPNSASKSSETTESKNEKKKKKAGAAHMSFDEWLEVKNNGSPPSVVSHKLNKNCKNHLPYPQAMCNSCMPHGIVIKRQEYRHIDYAQFHNFKEIMSIVQFWNSKHRMEQRIGFVYGYFCEDSHYNQGVRAIIEAIYEPPQKGDMSSTTFLEDPQRETVVDMVASSLGLECIGWIFTTQNNDTHLSSQEIRKAASYQLKYTYRHWSNYPVSKFLTIVLRPHRDFPDEIVPEVYMVSDQAVSMERDGVFDECERRKVLKIREGSTENPAPSVIKENSATKEVETDFFLVQVAHGSPQNFNFNIIRGNDFPVENRGNPPKAEDVKKFLAKIKPKKNPEKYSDFHFLLYIANRLDIMTAMSIGECIASGTPVPETIEEIIKSRV